jgi:hypothetical protein
MPPRPIGTLFKGHLFGRRAPDNPGVVDQYIDPSKGLHRGGHGGVHLLGLGNVAQPDLAAEASGLELGERVPQPGLAPGQNHEVCARFRQSLGNPLAQAAGPAGHQRGPAGEIEKRL